LPLLLECFAEIILIIPTDMRTEMPLGLFPGRHYFTGRYHLPLPVPVPKEASRGP